MKKIKKSENKNKKTEKKKQKKKTCNREEIEIVPIEGIEDKPIFPETGTRFKAGSARQLAFEFLIKCIDEGENNLKKIRKQACLLRKENGFKYNLDSGYIHFAMINNPEFFKLYDDDTVELVSRPKIEREKIRRGSKFILKAKKNARMSRKRRRENAVRSSIGI